MAKQMYSEGREEEEEKVDHCTASFLLTSAQMKTNVWGCPEMALFENVWKLKMWTKKSPVKTLFRPLVSMGSLFLFPAGWT